MEKNVLTNKIKLEYPKLYINELWDDNFTLTKENDDGFVEYKRTLCNCNDMKINKYATQMMWRITQNNKKFAIYFIGVNDDGTFADLNNDELFESVKKIIIISDIINASIIDVKIIHVNTYIILKITIKNKKIKNNVIYDI
jgi:elongation factor 1-alpha